jgi:hypothetical protein
VTTSSSKSISLSDSLGITDSVTTSTSQSVQLTESIGITDSVSASVQDNSTPPTNSSGGGGESGVIDMSGNVFADDDWSFAINDNRFLVNEFTNTIPVTLVPINTPTEFTVMVYDSNGVSDIQMVGLYMCLDNTQIFSESKCHVEYYPNGKNIVKDTDDVFTLNNVTANIIKEKLQVTFDISFDKEIRTGLTIQSWGFDRNSMIRYLPDALEVINTQKESAEPQTQQDPADVLQKQKKKAEQILLEMEQDEMEKNAAMLARIDAIEHKNQKLQNEQQIIDEALYITKQKLEMAIAQSKQRIEQILQHYDPVERISMQDILEKRELKTRDWEQMMMEKTDAERKKTLSSFKSKTPVRDYSDLLNNPKKIPNMADYIEFLEQEKQRMIDRKQDEITTADKILFEKIQNEIKEQQRRIMETERYHQLVYDKIAKK